MSFTLYRNTWELSWRNIKKSFPIVHHCLIWTKRNVKARKEKKIVVVALLGLSSMTPKTRVRNFDILKLYSTVKRTDSPTIIMNMFGKFVLYHARESSYGRSWWWCKIVQKMKKALHTYVYTSASPPACMCTWQRRSKYFDHTARDHIKSRAKCRVVRSAARTGGMTRWWSIYSSSSEEESAQIR